MTNLLLIWEGILIFYENVGMLISERAGILQWAVCEYYWGNVGSKNN